jgi:hypothetical protein
MIGLMIVGCADSAGSDGLKTGGRVPDLMHEAVDVAVSIRLL